MSSSELSHIDPDGRPRMVDVGNKLSTLRTASAIAKVELGTHTADLLRDTGSISKGNVIETARIAGIMAAKRTAELIPMCHPIPLDVVTLDIELDGTTLIIKASAKCTSTTGVEMEAMTAASVAALTVYDMCKSADKGIIIESIKLTSKTGGKSGDWSA